MTDENFNSNDQRDNIAPGTPVADIDVNQTGQDETGDLDADILETHDDIDADEALETEAEVGGDADIPSENDFEDSETGNDNDKV